MDIKQAFSRIESLPRSRKTLIFVAILVVICGSYWYFIYQPATNRIAEINDRIDSLEKQIAKYKKQVQKLPKLRKDLDKQKEVLAHAKTLLPEDEHEVEEILAQIERLGKSENVAFLSFNPGSTNKHKLYATRSLSIKLEGPFHNLMQFFSRISSLNTLITIESIDLNPVNQDTDEEISISSSVRLLVYRARNK
jgi:type IV pilus assembly protein PilO